MARRKSSSGQDILDIFLIGPWWLPLIAMVLTWFLFTSWLPAFLDTGTPLSEGFSTLPRTFAPYATGLVGLIGLVSWFKRWERRQLANRVGAGESLHSLSWRDFEKLVVEAFARDGYTALETPPGADGGVDIALRSEGKTYSVQCKHWKTKPVGVTTARELLGVSTARKDAGCFLVTSGPLTAAARAFCEKNGITCFAGHDVVAFVARDGQRSGTLSAPGATDRVASTSNPPATACPTCGGDMVRRKARKGRNAGLEFLGCSHFPKCRGMRSVRAAT